MATMTVNRPRGNNKQSANRTSRGYRAKVDAFVSECMQHAVAEDSRAKVFGFRQSDRAAARNMDDGESLARLRPHDTPGLGRKLARFMLTASLALVALAGTDALQAAIHVYVWRLAD